MAATTTLRVRTHTRDSLNRLAKQDQVSAPELLDRLIAREEENRLLARMNADFLAMRSEPGAWAEFKAETDAWDGASAEV